LPWCDADVGLTGAGWPRRDAVLALLNPFAARQVENQRLIERRPGVEVEHVEAFGLCSRADRMRGWPDMGLLRGRSRRGHHSNRVQSDFSEQRVVELFVDTLDYAPSAEVA
jgi:hypothetical protein